MDIGGLRRRRARQLGLTLNEYNRLGERDDRTDRGVDRLQRTIGRRARRFIFDGRLSFYFLPRSTKIFLYVSPAVGAARIWGDLRRSSQRNEAPGLRSAADVERATKARIRSDRKRYRKLYGVDPYQRKHYDLYLDTSSLSEAEVYRRVKKFIVDNLRTKTSRPSRQRR